MKIILKKIDVLGKLKPIGKHIIYGRGSCNVFLYEKGTIRNVKILNIPSFKITIEKQIADIKVSTGMEGSIEYNSWSFIKTM